MRGIRVCKSAREFNRRPRARQTAPDPERHDDAPDTREDLEPEDLAALLDRRPRRVPR